MSTPNTKTPPTPPKVLTHLPSSFPPSLRGIKGEHFAFTLVELIVVITILVILGTIAFLNLGGFSGSARDSARISNLANLQKGLNVYQVRTGTYPMPESSVAITASGTPIGYQGFAKDIVGGIAKISKGGTVDPSDSNIYTTYAVNQTLTKMQAMVFLEDSGNVTAFNLPLPLGEGWGEGFVAYASLTSDYSKRFPKTDGDTLGILLSTATGTLNQPVQESGTGVDVVLTNTGYLAVFSKSDSVSGSGSKLVAMKTSMTSAGTIPLRDTSLIGYWDMETTTADGKLADLSGNGNSGSGNGGIAIGLANGNGKNGKATSFDRVDDAITLKSNILLPNGGWTVSSWVKTSNGGGSNPSSSDGNTILSNNSGGPVQNNLAVFLGKIIYAHYYGAWIMNSGTSNINNGNWVFLTWVNFDNGTMNLYTNGKLEKSGFTSVMSAGDAPINSIGRNWGSTMDGLIDEVRIYNRALSDSEIQTLYNTTK